MGEAVLRSYFFLFLMMIIDHIADDDSDQEQEEDDSVNNAHVQFNISQWNTNGTMRKHAIARLAAV